MNTEPESHRHKQLQIAKKTREFERVDTALISARARVKVLEAEHFIDNLALTRARDEVVALAHKRATLRQELEALEDSDND